MKVKSIHKVAFLATCLLCSFLSINLDAQISIGVKAGHSYAWEEYGDLDSKQDTKINVKGYYVSILFYKEINKYFSIGTEPGFVQRGAASIPGREYFLRSGTKFKTNYFEWPLFLRGNFAFAENRFEVFGKMGYGGAIIVKGTEVMYNHFSDPPHEISNIDFKDSFSSPNRIDHGLYSGLGFGCNFGKNQLFVEGNYYHGLKDFDDNNTSKNRSLQLGVGFVRTVSW